MLLFPFTPDEVMKEIEHLLDLQRREKKPSAWVFRECNLWEDQNRNRVADAYGKFYHISAQARRVADGELSLREMKRDLEGLHAAFWCMPQLIRRFLVDAVKILGVGLLFTAVGLAHYGLSVWIGNVPAAGVIIGGLLAVVLIPQTAKEIWKWHRRRSEAKTEDYQQSILQRLWKGSSLRCPKCGKYCGDLPVDADGFVRCTCGNRIERKPIP
ncbi:MAG: hypothetical protein JW929_01870 [Anaerolineales bacterium]|nr:hypothetical protein [Anaerolineales bacterium]